MASSSATREVIDYEVPGIAEALRALGHTVKLAGG